MKDLSNLGIMQDEFRCIEETDFWSEEELKNWLARSDDICIGLFDKDNMIGYCLSHCNFSINKIFLENIFVLPSYRSKGLGKLLLNKTINQYKRNYPIHSLKFRFVALIQSKNLIGLALAKNCNFLTGETMIWMQK